MQVVFKDITLILVNLLLVFKVCGALLTGFFSCVDAVNCSIQNEHKASEKSSDKWPGIFVCTVSKLQCVTRRKNNTSSLIQAKAKNEKTKSNGVEIILNRL